MENKEFDNIEILSRLKFNDKEKEEFHQDFENILHYVEQLAEVNTDNVEPLIQVMDLKNIFREDIAIDSIGVEAALSNAPDKEGSSFRVPKVI